MKLRILIADDEEAARRGIVKALERTGHEILVAADGHEALDGIRQNAPDLVFLDLNMPRAGGLDVLRTLGPAVRTTEIIVVTANDAVQTAVECIRLGAADYITKPYEVEQLRVIVRRQERRLELERRIDTLESQLDSKTACGALLGASRPMQQLFVQIERAARAPLDVLVRGETGTGKELIGASCIGSARALRDHLSQSTRRPLPNRSPRANCSGMSEGLHGGQRRPTGSL